MGGVFGLDRKWGGFLVEPVAAAVAETVAEDAAVMMDAKIAS